MKTKHILLIVLTLIVLVLIATNPSKEKHVIKVAESAEQIFGKQLTDSVQNDLLGNVKDALGEKGLDKIKNLFGEESVAQAEDFVKKLNPDISEYVSRKNYFLFSLTQVEIAGLSQTIGIGILGSVYILA